MQAVKSGKVDPAAAAAFLAILKACVGVSLPKPLTCVFPVVVVSVPFPETVPVIPFPTDILL